MNNELYHYGVLGMKWGVRRYQPYGEGGYNPKNKYGGLTNKQYHQERRDKIKYFKKTSSINAEREEIARRAYALADKYDFDADDGGGGRTKADEKAGKKYMDLWEKYERLGDKIDQEALNKTAQYFVEKYGKETYSNLQKRAKRTSSAKGIAFIAALLGLPIAVIALDLG